MGQQYAALLVEFAIPLELRESGGWIFEREIPEWPYRDAMGCYPLLSCKDWSRLEQDIKNLEGKLISLALMTALFGDFEYSELTNIINVCFSFKDHFVLALSKLIELCIYRGRR